MEDGCVKLINQRCCRTGSKSFRRRTHLATARDPKMVGARGAAMAAAARLMGMRRRSIMQAPEGRSAATGSWPATKFCARRARRGQNLFYALDRIYWRSRKLSLEDQAEAAAEEADAFRRRRRWRPAGRSANTAAPLSSRDRAY